MIDVAADLGELVAGQNLAMMEAEPMAPKQSAPEAKRQRLAAVARQEIAPLRVEGAARSYLFGEFAGTLDDDRPQAFGVIESEAGNV